MGAGCDHRVVLIQFRMEIAFKYWDLDSVVLKSKTVAMIQHMAGGKQGTQSKQDNIPAVATIKCGTYRSKFNTRTKI